jgi:predicted branched-subunit amino acid permease
MITATQLTDARAAAATPWRRAVEGARDITPMVIGVVPFGLAIGAAIGSASIPSAAGLASGPVVLAGAAQLTVVQMLDAGAAPLVVILSALMINARLLLYSASLAPWFAEAPLRRRLLLAIPVIDQMHFTCSPRFERCDLDQRERTWYYVGAATWLVSAWVTTQFVAFVAGARLPEWTGLHLAAPLALAGLLAKSVQGRAAATAAVVAGVVAVIGVGLPYASAVLVAACAGIAVATATTRRNTTRANGASS